MPDTITLTDDELAEVTGYRQPAAQHRALLERGFWLARRSALTGRVILDRAHYEAVCRGAELTPGHGSHQRRKPQLRVV